MGRTADEGSCAGVGVRRRLSERQDLSRRRHQGRVTILELPDRAAAEEWARKIAAACRTSQELREFMYDPAS
jgi:hypothetical protein